MTSSIYCNTALGSIITIALIFIDYTRKFNTDAFQRKLFCTVLFPAFIAVLMDFTSRIISGIPGTAVHNIMYGIISLFYISQNCTYYFGAVFLDYFAHNDASRANKFIIIVIIFLSLQGASVLANLPLGFYFTISAVNIYTPGKLYLLRLMLSYGAILLIIIDVIMAAKKFKQSQLYLIVFFVILNGIGAGLDIALKAGSLTWPCYAGALLYIYFFIIQSDSKIDSLTGLGNRYSFNEFIDKLSRLNVKESYSIVMIDMDRFKEINDTLGHLEGDNALRDMAVIIKGVIRHSDFAARYGGDEFILAARAEYDIERIITRIQENIDLQNGKGVRPFKIYMSYGYDVYTTNSGRSIQEFISHVDSLMYKHKEEQRRCRQETAEQEEKHVR
jgi:diguanylate cyclase (GGDEF)-like protein